MGRGGLGCLGSGGGYSAHIGQLRHRGQCRVIKGPGLNLRSDGVRRTSPLISDCVT